MLPVNAPACRIGCSFPKGTLGTPARKCCKPKWRFAKRRRRFIRTLSKLSMLFHFLETTRRTPGNFGIPATHRTGGLPSLAAPSPSQCSPSWSPSWSGRNARSVRWLTRFRLLGGHARPGELSCDSFISQASKVPTRVCRRSARHALSVRLSAAPRPLVPGACTHARTPSSTRRTHTLQCPTLRGIAATTEIRRWFVVTREESGVGRDD
jgi:hypothetical protein